VANSSVTNKIFLVKSGEVMVVAADLALPDSGVVDTRKLAGSERQR
jgi:cGMP-dependent protein kinase